jgi:hypothetical protein
MQAADKPPSVVARRRIASQVAGASQLPSVVARPSLSD